VIPKQPAADSSAEATRLYSEAAGKRGAGQLAMAIPLFQRAANLGNVRAMLVLGELFREGEGNIEPDDKESMRWFRKAADAGNASGMLQVGAAYLLDEQYPEAAFWLGKAADKGNPAAMYNLAEMYKDGVGVAKDLQKAKQLYLQAAGLGNGEASKRLAQLQGNR
jgi:hypothetical protein